MSPILIVGVGILLVALGSGLGYWVASARRSREATKVTEMQKELDEYRRNVSEHFGETAKHFQLIGQQYGLLYAHMAQGAEALCDPTQAEELLDFSASDPAALAGSSAESTHQPEIIKDYAPDGEVDAASATQVEDVTPKQAAPADDPADAQVAEDVTGDELSPADPPVEDMAADEEVAGQSAPATASEPERIVH